jgi:hypothetical protein
MTILLLFFQKKPGHGSLRAIYQLTAWLNNAARFPVGGLPMQHAAQQGRKGKTTSQQDNLIPRKMMKQEQNGHESKQAGRQDELSLHTCQ